MLTVQEALDVVFPSKFRGYRRDEVEALLSRLVSSLAESDRGASVGLAIGAVDLEGVAFSRGFTGYDPEAVDEFLTVAAEALAERGVLTSQGHERVTAVEIHQLVFRRQVDGYAPRAIRRFLAVAAATLEAHQAGRSPLLSREESETVEFPLRFVGYCCDDVEAVCERITSTLAYYEARNRRGRHAAPDGAMPRAR